MKTRQGDSLFLKVDVGGKTVRVFGRPEELAERLEASGYDIPANEIEAVMELHLRCSCIRCCPDRRSPGREDGVPSRLRSRSPECRNHSLPDAPPALRDGRTRAPSCRRHPP